MERMKFRSQFSVRSILNNLSSNIEGDSNDNAFKFAIFNGVALVIVFIILITTSSVYFILNPFVKPLLWALLCGSALHPFKQALSLKFNSLLISIESSQSTPCEVIFWPFMLTSRFADILGQFLLSYRKFLFSTAAVILGLIVIYFYVPIIPAAISRFTVLWFVMCRVTIIFMLDFFSSFIIVGTLIASFACCLVLFWKPELSLFYSVGSVLVWLALTSYICGLLPLIRVPAFLFVQSVVIGCYCYSTIHSDQVKSDEDDVSEADGASPNVGDSPESKAAPKKPDNPQEVSLVYIRYLSIVCASVITFHLLHLLFIIPILLGIYFTKMALVEFGISDIIWCHFKVATDSLHSWYIERKKHILPEPLELTFKTVQQFWMSFISGLKSCSDSAAAVAVILCLLIFVFFGSFFLALQAYREGVYLVQTGGSIINSTIVHNPELHHLLPEDWESTLDTALNNTYIYVRESLASLLRNLLKDKGISESRAGELERNVLELWDRAYQAWVVPLQPNKLSTSVGPSVTADAVRLSFQSFIDVLKGTPEVASLESVKKFVSANMATLTSSLESVWLILKGNMSLLLGLLSACLSLVFGGGLSLINFIFHMVVFLTALFYLLSTSREMYKPVELITGMSPKYGNKLAVAVEKACQGVLAASAKLSLFYLMWTWLIHTLFQCNLVYMPAVFAAILGVVPVLGSYWACLPAVLDLWLVQDSRVMAIGLLLAQFTPTFIVDNTIYNEMRGGHPYLTGLSVAGGIFWLGLEGAIIGPLILCFLFVIVNIITDFNNAEESSASS